MPAPAEADSGLEPDAWDDPFPNADAGSPDTTPITTPVDGGPTDTAAQDQGAQLSGPGGACPCAAGNECVEGTCRARCNKPSGTCSVSSNCPADQACIATNAPGIWVCLPAAAPGAACNAATPCPVGHVCGSVDNLPSVCLPTCGNPTGGCGQQGGTCLKVDASCNFCSAL